MHIDHANEYYVATMEHLTANPYDLDDDEISRYDLSQSISELIQGEITQKKFIKTWDEYSPELFPWGFDPFFHLNIFEYILGVLFDQLLRLNISQARKI